MNKTTPTEEKIYLTRYHVGRPSDGNRSVVFVNEETGITQHLIDKTGHILNFPGIDCSDLPKTSNSAGLRPLSFCTKPPLKGFRTDGLL